MGSRSVDWERVKKRVDAQFEKRWTEALATIRPVPTGQAPKAAGWTQLTVTRKPEGGITISLR